MKALILAAGYATRLYPLTKNKAKPLLEVKGRPIIDYIIDKLEHCLEIDDIFVVTNEKFYADFCTWKKTGAYSKPITSKPITIVNDGTAENGMRLGAVGDIAFVLKQYAIREDLLVIAGDNLFSFSLNDFLAFYQKKKATIVAVYDTKDKARITNRLGCVLVDKNHKIIDFEEKPAEPRSTLAATACYLFPKEDLHLIEPAISEKHSDRPGDFIRFLAERKPVYGKQFTGYWFDVGTPEEYQLVNGNNVHFY